jgi:hypothetical protein
MVRKYSANGLISKFLQETRYVEFGNVAFERPILVHPDSGRWRGRYGMLPHADTIVPVQSVADRRPPAG